MYVPYLRARAEELRALAGLENLIKSGAVFPVLEPFNSTSELWSKLRAFVKAEAPFALVVNPPYGKLGKDPKPIRAFVNEHYSADLFGEETVLLPTYHIRPGTTVDEVKDFLDDFSGGRVGFVVTSDDVPRRDLERLSKRHSGVVFVAVRAGLPSSYRPDVEGATVVKVRDGFQRAAANAKYPEETFFSDPVATLVQEGYDGFGDFTTVGDTEPGGGWTPKAVAVHWTYENDRGEIRTRHFVSDDREDQIQGQVPRKIQQALVKLRAFVQTNDHFCGDACREFLAVASGSAEQPQLGGLKRLSIRHHVELMASVTARSQGSDS